MMTYKSLPQTQAHLNKISLGNMVANSTEVQISQP